MCHLVTFATLTSAFAAGWSLSIAEKWCCNRPSADNECGYRCHRGSDSHIHRSPLYLLRVVQVGFVPADLWTFWMYRNFQCNHASPVIDCHPVLSTCVDCENSMNLTMSVLLAGLCFRLWSSCLLLLCLLLDSFTVSASPLLVCWQFAQYCSVMLPTPSTIVSPFALYAVF